jgi:hypothetical protein
VIVIYDCEPNFPATDQNPDADRYFISGKCVDATGGQPTPAEVDAVLNPPETARIQSFLLQVDYLDLINRARTASASEIDTWLINNVTNLVQARTVLGAIIKLVIANRLF